MEGISDEVLEVARNLFNDGSIDYDVDRDGKATVNTEELPDLDDYEYAYGTTTAEILQQAIDLIVKELPNVTFYYDDDSNKAFLELSDNHTFWDINEPDGFDSEFDYDLYNFFVEQAFDEFENQTGVEAYQCGRSGRHICVDINLDNVLNYDKLRLVQAELEQQVIGEAESNCFGQAMEEAKELAPDEKTTKCLSCGMKIIYKNRDVQHDAMGDYIECPNCHSTFDIDYDNTPTKKTESPTDDAVHSFIGQMDKYMNSKGTDMDALKGIETTANTLAQHRPEFADMRYGDIYRALEKEYKLESKLTEAQLDSLNKLIESKKTEGKNSVYTALSELNVSNFVELKDEIEKLYATEIIDDDQYDVFIDIINEQEEKCEDYITRREKVTNTDDRDIADIESDYVLSTVQMLIAEVDGLDESKKVTEAEDIKPRLDGDETYVARNSSGYKSIGLIVNNKTKQFQIINGQVMTTDSRTKKISKKQIRDKAQQLYANGYEEYEGYGSTAQGVIKKTEAEDLSTFKPSGKVLSGNKGLSEDKIDEMRWALPDLFKDMTDEQKQIWEELSLREMVMSCLVYGSDIHTKENNVSLGKYRGKPYVDEYYDTLGKDVTEEIIKQQTDYFNRGKVIKNVGTDSEGVTYNSFEEPKDESIKVTEAEDMTQVKDEIETAVEKSDSTELEKDQVKGSLDVLKTDEESAIEGYEDFNKETAKVVDKELADAVDNQMQEIVDDEKEHIEKLDTIKSALGESKGSNKKLDYKLDGFKGVNIVVVDKKNNINAEEYLGFDSMEYGIDEYEFEVDMKDGIKDVLSYLYEYTDDYYDDRFTDEKISEIAEDITQDVLQLYDDLPDELIDFENGIADLSSIKSTLGEGKDYDFDMEVLDYLLDEDIITMAEYDHMNNVDYWRDLYNEGIEKAKKQGNEEMVELIAHEMNRLANTVFLEEVKFKDKVKAIKKSLKQKDKRLSDETAQASAEKIAGSMIKNEDINRDSSAEQKILGAIKTVNSKLDLPDIQIETTPKGDLHITTLDGKDIVTLDGTSFSDDDREELRLNGYYKMIKEDYKFKEVDYDDTENVVLDDIYRNLQNGRSYGKDVTNVTYPYFDDVLYLVWNDAGHTEKAIGWSHYGSSANKNTVEDLKWILDNIFELKPTEFVVQYKLDTDSKLNESKNRKTEKMGKDADKKYSNLYKYKGKSFAYDRDNAIVEYVYVDPDDNSWIVLDEVGLREDNWKNKEARDEYLDGYIAQLDDEANRLADDFIANEYLGESLSSRYIKTETKADDEKLAMEPDLMESLTKSLKNKLDFTGADLDILKLMYKRLDNLVNDVYDNRNADNIDVKISTILEKADVKVNSLPYVTTVNEGFNLALAVRGVVGKFLESKFGYDFYYESKSIKTEANGGTATIDLHTDLLPIINMYQYNMYEMLDGYVGIKREALDEMMLDFAKPLIEEQIKGVLPSAQISFGEFTHPKYYKLFSNLNDVLYFTVTYNVAEYEALKEKALKDPAFEQYLQDHYTSYDGFMSFFANNIKEFEEQEDWKQFVSVLSYYLPNDDEKNYDEMRNYVYENASNYDIMPIDGEVDYVVDEINNKVANDGLELNKENIISITKDLMGYLDEDDQEIIIDGVLEAFNLEESKKVEAKSKKQEEYEVWQRYFEDGTVTTEYVQTFDTYERAQKFADGLNQDPDCEAWVKDLKENKKVTEDFWHSEKIYYYKDIAIELSVSDRGYKQYNILNGQEPFSIEPFQTLRGAKKYIDDNNLVSYKKKQEAEDVATATKQAGEYWVGDPCYVIADDIYDGIWGKKYNYKDGTIDCGNGISFQVHGTAWGDGEYYGSNGFAYGVDAGVLAIVPMEIATKKEGIQWGTIHKSATAELKYDNGIFHMIFDNETIDIDTDPSDLDENKKVEDKELLTENDEIPVVNPDEQDYYDNKGYIISLYPRKWSKPSII